MKKTEWYPPHIKPVREGWYERDYSNTHMKTETVFLDLWQQFSPGNGYWYVDEPPGQINDAYYENLPWRGLTEEAK
jgi:hypothetical protein